MIVWEDLDHSKQIDIRFNICLYTLYTYICVHIVYSKSDDAHTNKALDTLRETGNWWALPVVAGTLNYLFKDHTICVYAPISYKLLWGTFPQCIPGLELVHFRSCDLLALYLLLRSRVAGMYTRSVCILYMKLLSIYNIIRILCTLYYLIWKGWLLCYILIHTFFFTFKKRILTSETSYFTHYQSNPFDM